MEHEHERRVCSSVLQAWAPSSHQFEGLLSEKGKTAGAGGRGGEMATLMQLLVGM